MKKDVFKKFIDLYYLEGSINQAKINIENNSANVKLMASDKTIMGSVALETISLTDHEICIGDTGALLGQMAPLGNDIELDYNTTDKKISGLIFKSNDAHQIEATYMLADPSVIDKAGTLKQVPNYELELELTSELASALISLKNSLPDSKSFTFNLENDQLFVIVGYTSDIATNRTTMKVPAQITGTPDLKTKSFSANNIKSVLSVNKGFKSGKILIYSQGLLTFKFEHEGMTSEYHLVQLKNV